MIHLSGGRQFQSKDGTSFETSSFERRFSIGPNADKEKIGADLKDGVLTITVPKKEPEKTSPTYIPITSGATKAAE
jgi:HSP20 family molecular chaperone IbpA